VIRIFLVIVLAGSIAAGIAAFRSAKDRNLVEPVTNMQAWRRYQVGGATAGMGIDQDGILCSVMEVTVTDPTCVQYYTCAVKMVGTGKYKVSFDAKSNRERTMGLAAETQAPPLHNLGLKTEVPLTTDWKHYDYEFEPRAVDGKPDKLPLFILGGSTGQIWIKNVVVKAVD
jgi:hypothetical protein